MSAKEALRKLREDNHLYFRKVLRIKDKKAQIIPFAINDSQGRLDKIIHDHYEKYPDGNKRPTLYIIILKARQQGMSTYTEGIYFKGITLGLKNDTPFNKVSMIISYDDDSANTINDMARRFLQYMPDVIKPMNRPVRGKGIFFENPAHPNSDEFKKNPGLQSKFLIDTANNKNAGSGYTINYLHISELAKWQDAETTMTSLLQSVPDYNGIVIVESTANGVGGYFYDLWQKAKHGQNAYVPLFIPWFEHKEYVTPLAPGEVLRYDEDEEELRNLYGLTDEQLKWRRNTIQNKCNNDIDKFKQEYPSNDTEAFLTSGRPRFDTRVLQRWLNAAKDGLRGYVEYGAFRPDDKGYVTIYEQPKLGCRYVIGADTSQGLATGDRSAATVWETKTWRMVAKWHGHIDPDLYAEQLIELGNYYNKALLAVEINNHGFTTMNRLKGEYLNLFQMERYDESADKTTRALGFQTNKKTKPLIIDHLAECIRDQLIETHDKEFISECITYIREDDGGTNAQEGCYDDLVMASAIALFVLSNYISDYFTAADYSGIQKQDQSHLPDALRTDDAPQSWMDY